MIRRAGLRSIYLLTALAAPAAAQIPLYQQRLPEGTVYIRLANALPGAASVRTGFAGTLLLRAQGAERISPYYVAGGTGDKPVTLQVTEGGATTPARFEPPSGSFITVVLHRQAGAVTAAMISDKPEYNQLRARLSFYNATANCGAGALTEAGRPIFSGVPADGGQARSINPAAATVIASCAAAKAPPLDLGKLEAGGLYSVWMMQPDGALTAFLARDTIAPPQD